MGFKTGDIVEVTGEIYGTISDMFGNVLYQICFENNTVIAVSEKIIKLKGMKKNNYIETKEYKPGRFK